jgi:hypothetical protein
MTTDANRRMFDAGRTARLEQERDPGAILRQYLASQKEMSPYARDMFERQGPSLIQSFLANAANEQATFADYLREDNPSGQAEWGFQVPRQNTQQNILDRLEELKAFRGQPPPDTTAEEDFQYAQANQNYGGIGGNQNVYDAVSAAALRGVNPLFRTAAGRTAQGVFDRFQGTDPSKSFLDYITKRKGFFGEGR